MQLDHKRNDRSNDFPTIDKLREVGRIIGAGVLLSYSVQINSNT